MRERERERENKMNEKKERGNKSSLGLTVVARRRLTVAMVTYHWQVRG